MNEEEIRERQSELDDHEIALIFLNAALKCTVNLKNDTTKHGFPDLDNRIARIESAIDRFQARVDITRLILAADTVAKANKAKE